MKTQTKSDADLLLLLPPLAPHLITTRSSTQTTTMRNLYIQAWEYYVRWILVLLRWRVVAVGVSLSSKYAG